MTNVPPPRLGVALLNHFLPDNQPLIGDLLEEYAARRSRLWFWRQVVHALLMRSPRNRAVRPLRLVDRPRLEITRPDIRPWTRTQAINLSGSPVRLLGAAGMTVGLTASLWLSRFVAPLVYGLEPRDSASLVTALLTLAAVGSVAAWLPARAAARVNPAEALRSG